MYDSKCRRQNDHRNPDLRIAVFRNGHAALIVVKDCRCSKKRTLRKSNLREPWLIVIAKLMRSAVNSPECRRRARRHNIHHQAHTFSELVQMPAFGVVFLRCTAYLLTFAKVPTQVVVDSRRC